MDALQNPTADQAIASPPPAIIRPFAPSDLKIVRYLIGSALMEPSAIANQSALWTPFVVIIWAVLTHVLVIRIGSGWPIMLQNLAAGRPFVWTNWAEEAVQYLKVLPTIAAPPIVLLALFELKHRNQFEEEMTRAIGEEDMIDIEGYYSIGEISEGSKKMGKSSSTGGRKGFFVLEYDNRIIGAFGVDGRQPGKPLQTIAQVVADQDSKKIDIPDSVESKPSAPDSPYPLRNRGSKAVVTSSPTTSPANESPSTYTDYVHLRRFGTSLSFRPAGIDEDLLNYATAFAFSTSAPSALPPAKKIICSLRPKVETALLAKLRKAGFKEVEKGSELEFNPESWRDGKRTLIARLTSSIWPIDLGFKTFVLDRNDWATLNKK